MKKSPVVLVSLLLIGFLTGCNEVTPHEHTFKTEFAHDETNHWHEASCEHTDLISGLKAHNFGDDNVCDDCGYTKADPIVPHEHTFANNWSNDETNHWHAATCEHIDLTRDLGKHVFNENGECEVCKMAIPSNYRKVVLNGENLSLSSEYYYKLCQSIEIRLSPLEGYTLPKDISVRGLSDYRYDNITGYIIGVVTDNVIITASGVLKGSKYYIAKETYKRNGGYNETEEIKTYNFDKEKRELEYIETLRTYFSPSSYADTVIKIVSKYDESFRIIEEQKFNYLDNEYQLYETSYREYNEKGLISRIRTTFDGVGFIMKTWEYDEFNRQTKHYYYSNETDELPSNRYEYTYYEDYYEEKYYFSFDQLGWHYKYREEIDVKNETKTIYKFTNSDESLGSTVYDLFSGQILAVYTNTVCTVSKFNQNGDEVSGMRYYPNDPIVMETEVNDYYDRKGFIEYREITEYPTSEDPVHYIEDYTNVDGYVQSIQKYCIDTVPYSVAFEKTYEIAPLNIDIEMPEGLRPALTRGTYISLVDGYSF